MNTTATRKTRTQRLAWGTKRAYGRISLADVLGRKAIYKTAAGQKLIGTIESEEPTGHHYLHVRFEDGRWARLDANITLVVED